MKKLLLKIALFTLFLFAFSHLNAAGIRVLESFTTTNAYWISPTSGTTVSTSGGHFNCTMALQGNGKYRGDLKFSRSGEGNGYVLNSGTDVYIAIKFIGTRPAGALKFEMKRTDNAGGSSGRTDGYYNTYNGGNPASVSTTAGNYIYYYKLTDDANYLSQAATNKEMQILTFIIADANIAPYEYRVDWIGTFTDLADLTAEVKDIKDDGETDADEAAVDPSTLAGYIFHPFTSNANGWVAATNEIVFNNSAKLIIKDAGSARLQTRQNNLSLNATNFPYLAVKIDALPAGFTGQENFHIQTNCAALSVYDSWYSVVAKKGDIYVFDMTACVNKNTSAPQDAITTTNNADVWIDFGPVSTGAVAQIGWIKTFQTLSEITDEVAVPLIVETNADAGEINFDFNTDNASTDNWAWKTTHWRGGEWGTKVSSSNGQLVMEPNDDSWQVAAMTTGNTYNTSNYPYLAVKVDDMGDAGYFKFAVSSPSRGGEFIKNSNAGDVTLKGTNVYVFNLSSYPMIYTPMDASLRMDFYQGTSGTTNPTSAVKVNWIRSFKTLEEIDEILSSTHVNQLADINVYVDKQAIHLRGIEAGSRINIYSTTGHLLYSGNNRWAEISIPFAQSGMFIVEILGAGNPVVVKLVK